MLPTPACLAPITLALLASTSLASAAIPADKAIAAVEFAGERVQLEHIDFAAIPQLDLEIRDLEGAPQFLLSDKPEYFRTGDGIAMQEKVQPGDVRLYLYHVPTPDAGPKKITALIENLGDEALTVDFAKAVLPKPGKDYHKIGKAGLVGFFSPPNDLSGMTLCLAPGETKVLDPSLLSYDLETDDLIHGIYEFNADQPARITTLQTSPGQDPARALDHSEKLPQVLPGWHASGAGRGLFLDNALKHVQVTDAWDTADGPAQIIFADGENHWIKGTDGITGEATLNKGNYGVVYEIEIPWTSSDGKAVALMVYNARAGAQWCGNQAVAVQLETEGKLPTGEHGIVELPKGQVRYGGPPEAVVVQVFEPTEAGTINLRYSPPGASCLPVPFVLLPIERD